MTTIQLSEEEILKEEGDSPPEAPQGEEEAPAMTTREEDLLVMERASQKKEVLAREMIDTRVEEKENLTIQAKSQRRAGGEENLKVAKKER